MSDETHGVDRHDSLSRDVAGGEVGRDQQRDIVVFGKKPASISSRNVFEGTVASLRASEGIVDLIVTTPAPLTVRITRAAAQDLGLSVGSRVWLALRSRAFRIVG